MFHICCVHWSQPSSFRTIGADKVSAKLRFPLCNAIKAGLPVVPGFLTGGLPKAVIPYNEIAI